jgi:hypothetical protein
MDVPRFSGDEDEFGIWWVRAKTYTARYGFQATMIGTAEGNLPANAGPGVNQGEMEAVERNNQAAYFLTVAMPDSMLLSVMEAGESNPAWPDHPKAHLMIVYLKSRFDLEEDDVEEDVNVEDDDMFVERLSNTVGVKYSDVVRHANEEAGSKEEEEDDDSFVERLYKMVEFADLLDKEASKVEARESVEDSSGSVEDSSGVNICRSGGTNEALQLNEALELHDHNKMSKQVKGSDDEHAQFLFDRGRAADSVVMNVQGNSSEIEQQLQARESAGIEGKQVQVCHPEKVQVWDSGRLQQLDDCVRGNDNISSG